MRFLVSVFTVLLCFVTEVMAQGAPLSFTPEKIAAIDALVKARMKSTATPGAALALFENGQIIYAKGYGRADEFDREITPDTPFNLGSLTKSFTALVMAQLAEEGRLDLDASVVKYLPDFHTRNTSKSDQITVRHLMGHKSGFSTLDGNRNQVQTNASSAALADAVGRLANVTLGSEPGTAYAYSNANYQVLGHLIETLDKTSYEKSIGVRILAPLQMQNSFALNMSESAEMPAAPFRFIFSRPHRYTPPEGALGRETIAQGGMFSSANDLARYIMDISSEASSLISPEGAQSLIALSTHFERERKRGYGLGWFVRQHENYTQVYHSGLSPGYQSLAGFVPERNIGFVILTNASGGYAYGHVGGLTGGVMDLVLDKTPRTETHKPSNKYTLWGVMMVPVLILLWGLRALRRLKKGGFVRLSKYKWMRAIRYSVPSSVLLGLVWVFAIYLPNAAGAPLSAAIQFNPDVGMALACAAGACGVWAVLRLVILKARFKRSS